MGKRSNFKRNPKDFYETPISAVVPLIPHLEGGKSYIDPCYGEGAIEDAIDELKPEMICSQRNELFPELYYNNSVRVYVADAQCHEYKCVADCFITNPPWQRQAEDTKGKRLPSHMQPLHRIINNLANQKPTWLIFDSDWAYTVQAAPYLDYCVKVVAVGRVSWMGNGVSGMDNASWYLFDKSHSGPTEFIGRRT